MSERPNVLIVGLDPAVVDFSRWPGLSEDTLRAALQAEREALAADGYDVSICFLDRGETAERVLVEALVWGRYDAVVVGAGVRRDEEAFLLFERLINIVHRHAGDAAICFNTGPADTAAAVRRWV